MFSSNRCRVSENRSFRIRRQPLQRQRDWIPEYKPVCGFFGTERAGERYAALGVGVRPLSVIHRAHPIMQRMYRPGDEKRSVVILRPADYDE